MWRAVPHRVDDYISVQRENLYQSLHTTVVDDNGQPLKIRVRTVDMERREMCIRDSRQPGHLTRLRGHHHALPGL